MSTRIKIVLLVGALLGAFQSGCARGATGNEADPDEAVIRDAGRDADDEEDADEEPDEPEDAGDVPDVSEPVDAALDASSEASVMDTGIPVDTGMSDAAADAGAHDAGRPDTGTPDAGMEAGRPVPQPLPKGTQYGEWTWVEVPGAQCRDGSAAGYYHRLGDDNLMIFLNGSGACSDKFFCGLIPKNVGESMLQETLADTSLNLFTGPNTDRQTPPNDGILKRESRNPVASWSMIFVPYCTGDVHAGANPDGNVPDVGPQKFVGYTNIGLFLKSFGPSFPDTKRVLLAGTGAGGFGALLNMERIQDYFDPQGAQLTVISDSGIPFQDAYLEACLQKKWRSLWNFEPVLPKNCSGCRAADGGGLATGLGTYLFKEKYKGRMMGGMISSAQDEIVKAFFSAGLNNCTVDPGAEALAQTVPWLFGPSQYPADRFPKGLNDVITNVVGVDNVAYYMLTGSKHMHLWRSRFYEQNGLGKTIAEWVADVLAGKATHVGTL